MGALKNNMIDIGDLYYFEEFLEIINRFIRIF